MKVIGRTLDHGVGDSRQCSASAPPRSPPPRATTTTTTTIKGGQPDEAYEKASAPTKFARASIGHSYQSAVQAAQSVYDASLAVARDSAERSTARATLPGWRSPRPPRPRGGASRPG